MKPIKKIIYWLLVAAILAGGWFLAPSNPGTAQACEYWVAPAPAGDDSNPGTAGQPWATLAYAAGAVPDEGCTVWFADGVYTGPNVVRRRFTTQTTFQAAHPYRAVLQNAGLALDIRGGSNMVFAGFELRHTGPGANALLASLHRSGDLWAENIILRDNIFHDSYNNDLLKIYNGSRFITVENNVFYNQGDNDQQMDVNSVTDVVIQGNIFFNDYAGSNRAISDTSKHFVIIKDSNEGDDGLLGSRRITVQGNVFLNWQGGREQFVKIGNDGKPYHEAQEVRVENNLMIGNSSDEMNTPFGVSGGKDILFANNTVVGDMPGSSFAFMLNIKGENPLNENIRFSNNIWADPTGTMGAHYDSNNNEFTDGEPAQTLNLVLDNNLYWNNGQGVPPGQLVSPLVDDPRHLVADPQINLDHSGIVLPRWTGAAFLSGRLTIRQELERLVDAYARIPVTSPATGQADPAFAPLVDILGRARGASPDLGAYEYRPTLTGAAKETVALLNWTDPGDPAATSVALVARSEHGVMVIADFPFSARSFTVTGLVPNTVYSFQLLVYGPGDELLEESNDLVLQTGSMYLFLPLIPQQSP